jgi:hypothetical protein
MKSAFFSRSRFAGCQKVGDYKRSRYPGWEFDLPGFAKIRQGAMEVKEKSCQAKRERKAHVLTFNLVIARAAGPWQSKRPFRFLCCSRKLNRHLDCHGAVRLAMTRFEVSALIFHF